MPESAQYSAAVRALKSMMAAEGTGDQLRARKVAAEAIVALRQEHEYKGLPDWHGNSASYRMLIQVAYRAAGVPSDSANGSLSAGLRHHIGRAVRRLAPEADLQTIARPAVTSRKRPIPRRPQAVVTIARRQPVSNDDPVSLVCSAIRSLEAVARARPTGVEAETIKYMLPALNEEIIALEAMVSSPNVESLRPLRGRPVPE